MTNILTKEKLLNDSKYIVLISYDLLFRELFGKNPDVTAFLISALLNIPYEEVKGKIEFKNTTVNKNTLKSKHGEKDVLFTVDIPEPLCINLEMNYKDLDDVKIERNVYFHSDTFSTTLEESDSYEDVPITIQFNFNDKFVNTKEKPLINTFLYRDEYGFTLTEKSRIVHINVAKMSKVWYSGKYKERTDISPIIFLLAAIMVEHDKKKFDELLEELVDSEISERIGDVVYSMNEERDFQQKYDDFMAEQRELAESRIRRAEKKMAEKVTKKVTKQVTQQVTQQVTEQNLIDTIIKMYQKDWDSKTISYTLDLDIQYVENIINEHCQKNSKSK